MTASARTPTPAPAPTSTPAPLGLTVHITDEAGAPIAGAWLALQESGTSPAVQTDATGQYIWKNLQDPKAILKVFAPGYFAAVQEVTLEPGSTEIALSLRRDPLGLLAADACAPDEKLLYLADFQDGQSPGWKVTQGSPEAWSVVPKDEGNQAASIAGIGSTQVELSWLSLENAVWRLRVQAGGRDGNSFLNFKYFRFGHDTRYIVEWGASPLLELTRLDAVTGDTVLKRSGFQARPGTWWYVEISMYRTSLQVWVDGRKEITAQDANPLPPGTIGVEAHIKSDPQTAYFFDDISVCELAAPFSTSLYKPPQ